MKEALKNAFRDASEEAPELGEKRIPANTSPEERQRRDKCA
jgi:hypothetical protein